MAGQHPVFAVQSILGARETIQGTREAPYGVNDPTQRHAGASPIDAASVVGTAELLLVRGIRLMEASWSHAVAAMTLVAIAAANWGLRLIDPVSVLPHGLALSVLGSVMVGFAGWHGGKLVFDHGIGILVSPSE